MRKTVVYGTTSRHCTKKKKLKKRQHCLSYSDYSFPLKKYMDIHVPQFPFTQTGRKNSFLLLFKESRLFLQKILDLPDLKKKTFVILHFRVFCCHLVLLYSGSCFSYTWDKHKISILDIYLSIDLYKYIQTNKWVCKIKEKLTNNMKMRKKTNFRHLF